MIVVTHRHRTRDDSRTVSGSTHLSDGVNLTGSYLTYDYYAEMHDNVNKKIDGKYKPSNCISLSHRNFTKSFGNGSVTDGRTYYTVNTPFPITPSDVNNLLPVVPDSLWETLCLDSFNEFSTQIPEEVGIANFAWELKEIAELIPKLSKTLLESVSGGYLNFQFGWKPFVGDLQKLAGLSSTVESKINYLISTWGKKVRLGYYRKGVIDDVFLLPTTVNTGGNPYTKIGVVGHRADFRGGGRLFHQLRGLKTIAGEIRAFISALGLNNPVKAVWNAIPFSFVAGWLTRIGGHLNTLAVNPFKGRWEVTDISFSLTERIVIYAYKNEPLNSLFWSEWGRIEVKRYTRLDGFPIGVTSFNLDGLNPSQLTLLGALTVGHLR